MAVKSGGLARTLRVALLLGVLAIVVVYAVHDVLSRRQRTAWRRTLDVALVIVTEPGVDAASVMALRRRVPELSARLARELGRYRAEAPSPFEFVTYGPTPLVQELPEPGGDGLGEAARYAWALHRFTSDVDDRASVPARGFDSRLYLIVKAPSKDALVEGQSEHGGRIGIARAELAADRVDVALFVAAHELFHTLGAVDHYGADGRALVPDGLAEPDRTPLFPQDRAEVMARNRPISATREVRPESLAELAVGPSTAREIGWASK
jgi:hypothetical protein